MIVLPGTEYYPSSGVEDELFVTRDRQFWTAGAVILNALDWKLILVKLRVELKARQRNRHLKFDDVYRKTILEMSIESSCSGWTEVIRFVINVQ